jgi:V/A-type H+/Na+-transporting ATPase subunit D
MAINFQYNKTSLQQLNKQLKVREKALPTLKNKEAALRIEVKKAKQLSDDLSKKLESQIALNEKMMALWDEFRQDLISIKDVHFSIKKFAGIKIPELESIEFEIKPFSVFNSPKWYLDGIDILKKLAQIGIEKQFADIKTGLLEYARKKTTQKVNLFEKVQIPGFQDAIRKIKRFMEDEDNLSKSAQKIVKTRQQQKEVA